MTPAVATKAMRLLTTGRVKITRVDLEAGMVQATVAGDTAAYTVVWWAERWECECEANRLRHAECSHITAV
ncbi:MAG TPA: hypothetical protein VJY65_13710, partial [Chloroflexota bacterium]|nr:hypothetical protein [Chloroflexota bacterium]